MKKILPDEWSQDEQANMRATVPADLPPTQRSALIASGSNKGSTRTLSFGQSAGYEGTLARTWRTRFRAQTLGVALTLGAALAADEMNQEKYAPQPMVAYATARSNQHLLESELATTRDPTQKSYLRAQQEKLTSVIQELELTAPIAQYQADHERARQFEKTLFGLGIALGLGAGFSLARARKYEHQAAQQPKPAQINYGVILPGTEPTRNQVRKTRQ